jgi:hypothetical protein
MSKDKKEKKKDTCTPESDPSYVEKQAVADRVM